MEKKFAAMLVLRSACCHFRWRRNGDDCGLFSVEVLERWNDLYDQSPAVQGRRVIASCEEAGYGDEMLYFKTLSQDTAVEGPQAMVSFVPDFELVTEGEKLLVRFLSIF